MGQVSQLEDGGEVDGRTDEVDRVDRLDSGRAWLVVVGACLALFAVFGIAYSFGAFFKAMSDDFGASRGSTTLLFGIANFLYFTGGLVTGRIGDRAGPRPLLAVAAVSLGGGLALTSVVDRLWLGYLTYGLGVGIAVACAYVPTVAAVGSWFVARRTVAVGIAVAGIGLGNLTASYGSPYLIDSWGWRGTYRFYAVVAVILLGVAFACSDRPPRTAAAAGPVEGLGAVVRTRSFLLLYASMFVFSQALFVPFVFLPSYAEDNGVSPGPAAALVGVIGGASVFGRLVLGGLGGRLGVVRLYRSCLGVAGAALLLWLVGGGSYPVLFVFALVFGVAYGGFIALAPAVTASIFGTRSLGAILGALYTAAAFGGIGLYLAGNLIDATDSYESAIVAALVVAVVAVLLLLPVGRDHPEAA